jgi:nondiscriminating glutamyl-tRNA synthetase
VHEYLENGYLPEALINFLALLGWWPPGDFKPKSGHPEIISREELVSVFNLEGLQKAPGVFDVQKLRWMNAYYLHHMPVSEVAARARPFFEKAGVSLAGRDSAWFERVVEAVRGEAVVLSDLPGAAGIFFEEKAVLGSDAKAALVGPVAAKIVEALLTGLSSGKGALDSAEVAALEGKIGAQIGEKGRALFLPIRAVITGKTRGPELNKVLPLLGREAVIQRIKDLKKQAGL